MMAQFTVLIQPPDRPPEARTATPDTVGDLVFSALRAGQRIYDKFQLDRRVTIPGHNHTIWSIDVGMQQPLIISSFLRRELQEFPPVSVDVVLPS
jgi:hypothetical protein